MILLEKKEICANQLNAMENYNQVSKPSTSDKIPQKSKELSPCASTTDAGLISELKAKLNEKEQLINEQFVKIQQLKKELAIANSKYECLKNSFSMFFFSNLLYFKYIFLKFIFLYFSNIRPRRNGINDQTFYKYLIGIRYKRAH